MAAFMANGMRSRYATAQDAVVARQYLTDHATFVRTARMWTGMYPHSIATICPALLAPALARSLRTCWNVRVCLAIPWSALQADVLVLRLACLPK